jgi:hypothetical protein
MKARMRVAQPLETEVTLQITMEMGSWKKLCSKLDNSHPEYWLKGVIERALTRINSVVEEEVDITATTPPPAP